MDLKEVSILVVGKIPIIRSGIEWELHKAGTRNVFDNHSWQTQCSETGDHIPDVIVIGIDRVDDNLSGYVQDLQCNYPGGRILVLCPDLNDIEVYRVIKMGVSGMVENEEPPENFLLALQTVAVGQTWFSACFAAKFPSLSPIDPEELLTQKEIFVLNSLVEGKKDKEIASELRISERTVRYRLRKIYNKIHVEKKLQAVLWAVKHNFIRRLN